MRPAGTPGGGGALWIRPADGGKKKFTPAGGASMMGSMRHLIAAAAVLPLAAVALPALAVREPNPLKASSGSFLALAALLLVVGLIIGASMMNPRRTHQD